MKGLQNRKDLQKHFTKLINNYMKEEKKKKKIYGCAACQHFKNIGFLRQWLNEDRNCTPMVTNEEIKFWLTRDFT